LGKVKRQWQDTDYVLGYFGKSKAQAGKEYESFVKVGLMQGRKVKARSLLCFRAARELGMSHTALAKELEMSVAGVGFSVERGEIFAKDGKYSLES
jgi:hypothetical protein